MVYNMKLGIFLLIFTAEKRVMHLCFCCLFISCCISTYIFMNCSNTTIIKFFLSHIIYVSTDYNAANWKIVISLICYIFCISTIINIRFNNTVNKDNFISVKYWKSGSNASLWNPSYKFSSSRFITPLISFARTRILL